MKKAWEKRFALLFSLIITMVVTLGFGGVAMANAEARNAQPENPQMNESTRKVVEFIDYTIMMCNTIYPRPKTLDECLDKVKHGVGSAFDPHSGYLNRNEAKEFITSINGRFGGLGIEILKPKERSYVFIVDVIEGTPAEKAGLMSGDSISKIGDISTLSLDAVEKAITLLRGKPGDPVTITVERKGLTKPLVITLVREEIKVVQISGALIRSGQKTYALITARQFNRNFAQEMKEKFFALEREAKKQGTPLSGLVINMENNPGGLLNEVYNALDLYLDVESTVLERNNKGIDVYRPTDDQILLTPGDITKGLPKLVIVNSGSASASEIFSATMQHYGSAVVAGTSETFGKGTVQTTDLLPDGGMSKITIAEYLVGSREDWRPVQCVGVMPDILFTYPGIAVRKGYRECELSGNINSGGAMLNGPVHRPIKEVRPGMYNYAEEMLSAFIAYRTPELKKKESLRKMLESQ